MPTSSDAALPASTPSAARNGLGMAEGEPVAPADPHQGGARRGRRPRTSPAASPRTRAAGTPSALPLTRSAAAATSSASARASPRGRARRRRRAPRRSSSTRRPGAAEREVDLTDPPRPAGGVAEHDRRALSHTAVRAVEQRGAQRARPRRRGRRAAGAARPSAPVLEASTPAAAITGPAADSTTRVTRPGRAALGDHPHRRRPRRRPRGCRQRRARAPWRRPCSRRRGTSPSAQRACRAPRAASTSRRGEVVARPAPRGITGTTVSRPQTPGSGIGRSVTPAPRQVDAQRAPAMSAAASTRVISSGPSRLDREPAAA